MGAYIDMTERQMEQLEVIRWLLYLHNMGDNVTDLWLNAPNLNFGGAVPMDLIHADRGHKVIQWLKANLEGA
jgi:hypothetical protein